MAGGADRLKDYGPGRAHLLPVGRILAVRQGLAAIVAVFVAPAVDATAARPDRGADVAAATVDTFTQRNGAIFTDWPDPRAIVVITGQLDGYIEPCGCTAKEDQKAGLSRRQNFLRALEAAGWPVLAVDLGSQVRRFGRQSEVKFQSIADGLKQMGYAAVGFGPSDLRLPAEEGGPPLPRHLHGRPPRPAGRDDVGGDERPRAPEPDELGDKPGKPSSVP